MSVKTEDLKEKLEHQKDPLKAKSQKNIKPSTQELPEAKLAKERMKLSTLAIDAVKESLRFGAANSLAGITVIPKVHAILKVYLPLDKHSELSLAGKKASISQCIKFIRESVKLLKLSSSENNQLEAVIANYLMHYLFGEKLARSVEDFKSLKEHSHIIRTFQTGNCGNQVLLALEYLLENHLNNPALYPMKIFEAHKKKLSIPVAEEVDPEHRHQSLLLGRLSEEDPAFGQDVSLRPDPTVCDPWQGKTFLFSKWLKEAPPGFRSDGFDFDNSATLFPIETPDAVKAWLAGCSKKPLNISVTQAEVNEWVNSLAQALRPVPQEPSIIYTYIVSKLTDEQRKLIQAKGGQIVKEEIGSIQFKLSAEHLKSTRNGGIRETLGLERVAISKLTAEQVTYLKDKAPQITLEVDPKDKQRYIASYEPQYRDLILRVMKEWPRLQAEQAAGKPILPLKDLQKTRIEQSQSNEGEKVLVTKPNQS